MPDVRQGLSALVLCIFAAAAACGPGAGQPSILGEVSEAEFRQPLPEPRVHQVARPPQAADVLARATTSMRSARFQIVGTEPAGRMQGQIGAQVYKQDGILSVGPPAMELQPLDQLPGQNPNIDGRGNYIVVGSTQYQRGSTLSEWELTPIGEVDAASHAYINPATWQASSNVRFVGEASINGSPTWVIRATDAIGRPFRAWIRETDGYPLRYTTSYVNIKKFTYYINALYLKFNIQVGITPPALTNHGIVRIGEPIPLRSGVVMVTSVDFDCSGTATRRPAPMNKFVTLAVAFNNTGTAAISITPDAWRLYGDGTDGPAPVDTGSARALRTQSLKPGRRAAGIVTFELAQDAYQLIAVGKFPDVTAVVGVPLPMLPNGVAACP